MKKHANQTKDIDAIMLELKKCLDALNISLSGELNICRKHCKEIIKVAGELDATLGNKL